MFDNNSESKEKIILLLERNNELLTSLLKSNLSNIFENELSDTKLRRLYDLIGDKPVKEIAKTLSMGDKTITATCKRWESLGLLAKEKKGYRRILND